MDRLSVCRVVVEMTTDTIYWSDRAMIENAPGLSHWTGWQRPINQARLIGRFLWTGEVQFWSGRCETVFYHCSTIAPSIEVLKAHPLYGILEATAFYDKIIRLAAQGYLYKWKSGKRLRPVRCIGWERWPGE